MTGCHIDQKKTIWKLDNGPKHTPSYGERCVGHFYAPSRCHSRSRWVRKWVFLGSKTAKMTGCHIRGKIQPGNKIMDQNTPTVMGIDKALLCPIQVAFQVLVGPKMSIFDSRMPYMRKNSTWKQDNGPKHTPSNGNRCVGHFYALFRWQFRSWWVQKWVFLG